MPESLRKLIEDSGLIVVFAPGGAWQLLSNGRVVHEANTPEDIAAFVMAWRQYVR